MSRVRVPEKAKIGIPGRSHWLRQIAVQRQIPPFWYNCVDDSKG
jgi:hypothetical protein